MMCRKSRLFLVIVFVLFIASVSSRTKTAGDVMYSVYHLENAITKSGKVIPLGLKFQGPRGDPVASFMVTIDGRTEKVEATVIGLASVSENE